MTTKRTSSNETGATLVAGYDGTEGAAAAVHWAAARALDGGRLVVVCAGHPAVTVVPS